MKALVTGGAGFIGSNLTGQLLAGGHIVTVLDNLSSGYRSNLEAYPQARFIEGDIRDENAVSRAMEGAEVVFHLAASVGNKRSIDHPADDAEINVIGTLRILEAARRIGVHKIIASSSAGIFGEPMRIPLDEDHPVEPGSPYGCTKLCMEKQCLAYANLYDIETVCLRYFNVYGMRQYHDAYGNVIPIFAFRMLRGQPLTVFGDGEQTRDFVNVHDIVQANIKAALSPGVCGVFNIGSGTKITINELISHLIRLSGIEPKINYTHPRPGDVYHSMADISAARNQIGYEPVVSIIDGLAEYIVWARGCI
ncbi:NAD-dependent epimerase/dehydratase family protein [bacterium]|nr:NAD-dependent epimerase/dehydratase family protein [bacterium]